MRSQFKYNGSQNSSKRSFDPCAVLTKSVVAQKQHLTVSYIILALFADLKIFILVNICELTIRGI